MRLTPPTTAAFLIAALLAVISIVSHEGLVTIPVIGQYSYWTAIAAWALLSLSVYFKKI